MTGVQPTPNVNGQGQTDAVSHGLNSTSQNENANIGVVGTTQNAALSSTTTNRVEVVVVAQENATAATTLAPCLNGNQSTNCTEFRAAEARAWNAHSAVYNRLEERRRQQEEWNAEQRHLLSEQTKLLGEARVAFFKL